MLNEKFFIKISVLSSLAFSQGLSPTAWSADSSTIFLYIPQYFTHPFSSGSFYPWFSHISESKDIYLIWYILSFWKHNFTYSVAFQTFFCHFLSSVTLVTLAFLLFLDHTKLVPTSWTLCLLRMLFFQRRPQDTLSLPRLVSLNVTSLERASLTILRYYRLIPFLSCFIFLCSTSYHFVLFYTFIL